MEGQRRAGAEERGEAGQEGGRAGGADGGRGREREDSFATLRSCLMRAESCRGWISGTLLEMATPPGPKAVHYILICNALSSSRVERIFSIASR